MAIKMRLLADHSSAANLGDTSMVEDMALLRAAESNFSRHSLALWRGAWS